MCYFYMGIVRRGAEGDLDALEHFSPRPNGHFLVLVVCAMSKNRWKNRSEKMLYGACLTEGGKDWGSLKPFGQCPYGNNTFQKGAALIFRTYHMHQFNHISLSYAPCPQSRVYNHESSNCHWHSATTCSCISAPPRSTNWSPLWGVPPWWWWRIWW